ncbi:MAG: hypothetical protein ACYCVD_01840 [Desulfitobacteriaceae bacterium]
MRENDDLVLECLEDVHYFVEEALKRVNKVRTVQITELEHILEELRSQRRTIEEISHPARLIVEQLLEAQLKSWQVALETEHFNQAYSSVRNVKVEEFGLIRVRLGDLEISWRDRDYLYYFYPDKVELRAVDEKSAIKLFFSLAFSLQAVEKFPEILSSPNVIYVHPQLEKWLKKVF